MIALFKKIVSLFKTTTTKPVQKESSTDTIWCLTGNIIDSPAAEDEDQEQKPANKHFKGNTKVYCFYPIHGFEKIRVIGKHKKSKRTICIVLQTKYITNWQVEQVNKPYIVKLLSNHKGGGRHTRSKEELMEAMRRLQGKK